MKILHVSFSKAGGAGIVANNLNNYFNSSNNKTKVDSEFLYISEGNLSNVAFSQTKTFLTGILDYYLVRNKTNPNLFTLLRSKKNSFETNLNFDLIHLHWTPGIITLKEIEKLSNVIPVVWTLHDMWPFTGGCHHSGDCVGFKSSCANCPQVIKVFQNQVVKNRRYKNRLTQLNPNLHFTAPSKWMLNNFISSQVFNSNNISLINNPIESIYLNFRSKNIVSRHLNIGFVASNLDDNNKQIYQTLTFLLSDLSLQKIPIKLNFFLVGGGRRRFVNHSNVQYIDYSNDPRILINNYLKLDLVIIPSLFENIPNVLLESMALGIPVICRNTGGMPEIIKHKYSGLLFNNHGELSTLIPLLLDSSFRSYLIKNASSAIRRDYLIQNIAKKYELLYETQIKSNKTN